MCSQLIINWLHPSPIVLTFWSWKLKVMWYKPKLYNIVENSATPTDCVPFIFHALFKKAHFHPLVSLSNTTSMFSLLFCRDDDAENDGGRKDGRTQLLQFVCTTNIRSLSLYWRMENWWERKSAKRTEHLWTLKFNIGKITWNISLFRFSESAGIDEF